MIRYMCDRCGKEVPELEAYIITVEAPKVMRYYDDYMYTIKSYQICPDCIKEVADYISDNNDDCQLK